jgi:MFS family permease
MQQGTWAELFRGKTGFYTAFILLGTSLYSIQVLAMVTVMPTVIADIGGSAYYVWTSMLYGVGTIIGGASVGPALAALGMRRMFLASTLLFMLGTLACALSPDMLLLVVARGLQGFGGGIVTAGTMALVSRFYEAGQRTQILALYQGAWTVCSLLGPVFGGAFAELGWWRGIFWTFVPLLVAFLAMAYWMLPRDEPSHAPVRLPLARLGLLAFGVMGIAQAGQLESDVHKAALLVLATAVTWLAFPLDARSKHRLFPSRPLSVREPVGLGYWIFIIVGAVQGAVTIFLPLSLQVVHELTPLLVGAPTLVLSIAWTIATFWVTRWSGERERFALNSGPVFMLAGIAVMLVGVYGSSVSALMVACFVLGFGIGIHNIHLSARIMSAARPGEEAITASSMSMIRPLGMAAGTAAAGMVANIAGLGESVDKAVVDNAVASVMVFSIVPLVLALIFIVRLSRLVIPAGRGALAERS